MFMSSLRQETNLLSLFKTRFGYLAFRLYTHWDSTSTVHLLLLYWRCQSFWLCGSQQIGKVLKRWGYQTTLPASWEICMQVRKQQLEMDMEQQTGSKLGKEYVKAVYCHPDYLPYMQNTSCKMLGLINHKLASRLLGKISITSDTQMTPPLWQKVMKN